MNSRDCYAAAETLKEIRNKEGEYAPRHLDQAIATLEWYMDDLSFQETHGERRDPIRFTGFQYPEFDEDKRTATCVQDHGYE